MADNQENLMDETSDEMNLNYRTISLSHEDDENEEGMAEYLDLDLENASVEDTADTDKYSNCGNGETASNQSSFLRDNHDVKTSCSRDNEKKSFSGRSTTNVSPKNRMPTKSTTSKSRNTLRRGTKRKTSNSCRNVDATTRAVDEINANFANSRHFINDIATNETNITRNFNHSDSSSKCEITAPEINPDMDGVDLFFQSMAQTVMSLPIPIQARVKMDICKIIAKAEMKYSIKTNSSEVF